MSNASVTFLCRGPGTRYPDRPPTGPHGAVGVAGVRARHGRGRRGGGRLAGAAVGSLRGVGHAVASGAGDGRDGGDDDPPPERARGAGARAPLARGVEQARAAGRVDRGRNRAVRRPARGRDEARPAPAVAARRERDGAVVEAPEQAGHGRRLRSVVMATGPAIEASGLVKRYDETVALGGVDLDVPRGAVLALLGPNGAGKTTTVRILTTLTVPTEGTARVAGFDVTREPVEVRRRIGLAAQDATVDELLTGRENLVMIAELHHLPRKRARTRADELLQRFDLSDTGDRLAREYSGGMRRRLDLAATLVNEPEILFLDEPTTGLDPRARNDLWGVLEHLVEGGVTVLLTTQYLEEAERLADDIAVVDHGRAIARGDARSLKREVGGDQLHVIAVNEDDLERIAEVMGRCAEAQPSVDRPTRSVTAPTAGGPGAIAALASELGSAGIAVEDLGLRQPTLDDVFLTLTGSSATEAEAEEELEQVA